MKPFLHSLAEYLLKQYTGELEKSCILFPNRRAGLFFKKYYADLVNKSGWLPEVITIGDFISRISEMELADPLELSFEVYGSFRAISGSKESYDEFYPWGEMMISDFDDIDKYLVNASDLFRNITDLREIDHVFDYLDEDQKQLISRFWKSFDHEKMSDQKESFLHIWKILYPVYIDLRKKLQAKGLAYDGMMYRAVAEHTIVEPSFQWPWEKVFIAGFNALSKSEERIFSHLRNSGRAKFYWDYDLSYTNNTVHEAGRFLRRNLKKFPPDTGFDPGREGLSKGNKKVTVLSLPSDVLQAKELYSILENHEISEKEAHTQDFNELAVILGDESLLPAVLTSLPENVDRLNITMGYPVSQTPVYSFIEAVLKMQQNLGRRKKTLAFYYRDVLSILNHQYIKSFYSGKVNDLVVRINRENKIYINREEFENDSLFAKLFSRQEDVHEMVNYLLVIFDLILDAFTPGNASFRLEKEYIFHIRTRLNKLKNLFENLEETISVESFIRLFRKVLSDFRIPFEGEPLQGAQFMGILESRLLDFRKVIFLSLNEGVMPASSAPVSYIPANLRFAFGMSVREDRDSIYAYYFYRLLQRAEEIDIMYNSQAEGIKTGEPGRYIYQLEYLSNWKMEKKTRAFRVHDREPVSINIEKDKELLDTLEKYTTSRDGKYLSPSALTAYMDCPLRFYFTYVAGIREEDEASEDIDASGFGSMYHKTMELIYQDYRGESITSELISNLEAPDNIKKHLDRAFREEFLRTKDENVKVNPEGRNIIIYEIIRKMVMQTLLMDRRAAPFTLVDTEQNIKDVRMHLGDSVEVRLGGKIDRLDIREDKLHVIDYKTGKVSMQFPSLELLFDRNEWPDNENMKGIFQTLMYSWLYMKENQVQKPVIPSICQTRNLFISDFTIFLKDRSTGKNIDNFVDYKAEFENRLHELVNEIFNPVSFFSQTEDEKRCRYCPYKEICHRDP